jgi:type II secretory pathway component PulF
VGQFEYQAVDEAGGRISGTVVAADRRSAVSSLAQKGQFVTSLSPRKQEQKENAADLTASEHIKQLRIGTGRVSSKDMVAMTGQLSVAVQAGLPLLDCLRVIEKQTHKPAMKYLLGELSNSVSSGSSLSEAMSQHKKIFKPLYLAMVRVGETGGILEQTMGQLAELLKREEKIKSDIKTASAYPLIVLAVGIISVIIIITKILPKIVGAISETGAALPLPTKVLMGLSEFIASYWFLMLIGVILTVVVLLKWISTPSGRFNWDRFKLKIPILGAVQRAIAIGRFTRTLGSLSKGGITILEALQVVRDTLGNELLAREIDNVKQKVKTGEPLAEPLERSGYFPPLLVQIVSVGEQTGKLDELLLNASETFDSEADAAIARFMAVLPALLVLLLAAVIGFIVAGALLPIVAMQLGAGGV